jgi:hypothetical protein
MGWLLLFGSQSSPCGGLLVPEGIIHPVVSVSSLIWFISRTETGYLHVPLPVSCINGLDLYVHMLMSVLYFCFSFRFHPLKQKDLYNLLKMCVVLDQNHGNVMFYQLISNLQSMFPY